MEIDNEENKTNEPKPDYSKQMVFFKSFEEMNEYDHKEMALLTPSERMQNITAMIMEIYRNELKQPMTDLTIYFK
jgi:hypothetical protein